MKEVVITTQAEYDALPASFVEHTRIIIKSSMRISVVARENSRVVAWGNSRVEARGNSSVVARENSRVVALGNSRVEAWENSRVEAWENSSVEAWENSSVEAWGNSSVVAWENSSVEARENSSVVAWENSRVVAWGNSSVVAWENSRVVARGNSSVVAWENSSVEAWENSRVVAWGNSSVVAWGNSRVEARENSSVEAWGNSSVVVWENSSVVARGNSVIRVFSALSRVALFGFAVAFLPSSIEIKIEKKSEHAHIQVTKDLGWFERNGVEKSATLTLYKRVSSDWKTQENTKNETTWTVGTSLIHPKWNPTKEECGPGKFHACSRPYFCDEVRSETGDRYIAISVKLEDVHEWPNPDYPHKIAFRAGTVLYECDRFGKQITVEVAA